MDLEEADQPSGSGEIPEKVQNRLEDWKKSLIDLSLRNRLLNYSPRKRSTVEIVDELPQITLRGLLQGKRSSSIRSRKAAEKKAVAPRRRTPCRKTPRLKNLCQERNRREAKWRKA